MKPKCSIFIMQLILFSSLYSQNFEVPIEVSDGIFSDTLIIGVHPNGTDGYDDTLDILAPPLPPSGAFGTLLEWNYEQYYKDIRDNSTVEKTFQLHYQESSGGAIVLNWDSTGLSQLGTFIIEDRFTGTYFSLDMTTTNTLDVYSYSILNDWLKIKVTPNSMVISDSIFVSSGDPPPVKIGNTGVTVDFSECPGGNVYVDQYGITPVNLSGNIINKTWDIYSDMNNFSFRMDLRIDYSDTDVNGLNETLLTIAFLDTIDSIWYALDSTEVFPDQNYVVAYDVNHMTNFAVGEKQLFNDLECFAGLRLFLEGPYDATGDTMLTTLLANNYIPLNQPYSVSPWNYSGNENTTAIPENVVDWILVELRTGTDTTSKIAERAAFLKNDGSVVDLDGVSNVRFENVISGEYYIVIHHRNHLSVMSSAPILLSASPQLYDFTTGPDKFYGTDSAVELESGIWGLYAGEGNYSGIITIADRNDALSERDQVGYSDRDYNLSGIVTMSDVNLSLENRDANTKVEN